MEPAARSPLLFQVGRLDLRFTPKPWAFAEKRRADIDAFFETAQRANPALWNGRVLLMHHQRVADGVFSGDYLETDYASFAAWKAWGQPKAGIHDCFGAAAIVASDNAVLLGVMGPRTFNAGRIYFPCGTPDPDDIIDGRVDLAASVARELKEETGCAVADFDAAPGWTTIVDGGLIAQVRTLRSAETAETLREKMLAYLALEQAPELADIRIVRGLRDIDPAMPRFVVAFLVHHFGAGA